MRKESAVFVLWENIRRGNLGKRDLKHVLEKKMKERVGKQGEKRRESIAGKD